MNVLGKHLHKAFDLTYDLVQGLSPQDLGLRLGSLPSNTIGEQLWCMIGARESYLKAIVNQGWVGFSCSLHDVTSKDDILQCLEKSDDAHLSYINDRELNDVQLDLALTLLEHEVQHHGQLIRYIYGNKLDFPKSWNERYTV